MKAVLLAIALLAIAAVLASRQPTSTVRVPAKSGTPADLPAWAREEIVTLRLANLDLCTRLDKELARQGHLVVVHYCAPYRTERP